MVTAFWHHAKGGVFTKFSTHLVQTQGLIQCINVRRDNENQNKKYSHIRIHHLVFGVIRNLLDGSPVAHRHVAPLHCSLGVPLMAVRQTVQTIESHYG